MPDHSPRLCALYADRDGFDAALIAAAPGPANTHRVQENCMNDLLYIAIFLACCAATVGLLVLCERLMPRETGGKS